MVKGPGEGGGGPKGGSVRERIAPNQMVDYQVGTGVLNPTTTAAVGGEESREGVPNSTAHTREAIPSVELTCTH